MPTPRTRDADQQILLLCRRRHHHCPVQGCGNLVDMDRVLCRCSFFCVSRVLSVTFCVCEALCVWSSVCVKLCVCEALCVWSSVRVKLCACEALCVWSSVRVKPCVCEALCVGDISSDHVSVWAPDTSLHQWELWAMFTSELWCACMKVSWNGRESTSLDTKKKKERNL